jgi:serine protease Do
MLSSEYLTENCEYDDRYETTRDTGDVFFDVQYDIYVNCGGEDNAYGVVVAQSDPPDQIVFIDFVAVTEADTEAFDVLLQSFSIDTALIATSDETLADENSTSGSDQPAVTTIPISDDSGTISVRVPESWEDIVSEDWILNEDEGPVGVALTAAPDAQGFNDRWDVPGIFIGVSDNLADRFTPPDVLTPVAMTIVTTTPPTPFPGSTISGPNVTGRQANPSSSSPPPPPEKRRRLSSST